MEVIALAVVIVAGVSTDLGGAVTVAATGVAGGRGVWLGAGVAVSGITVAVADICVTSGRATIDTTVAVGGLVGAAQATKNSKTAKLQSGFI